LSDAVPKAVSTGRTLDREGLAAAERGSWNEAEEKFREAIRANPKDPFARLHHAEALLQKGEADAARSQLAEAVRLAPDDPILRIRLAEMHLAQGEFGPAAMQTERALQLDPQMTAAWSLRGEIRFRQGEAQAALADYYRALRNAPGDVTTLARLADAYSQLGEPHLALAAVQDARDQFPPGNEPTDLLVRLGEAYLAAERSREALETLAVASNRGELRPELAYRVAEVQLRAGHPTLARRSLEQALAAAPQDQASLALRQRIDEEESRRR
jgi:tetratricopeptide (TPR) repeat protein